MDNPTYLLESVKLLKDWAIWVTGIQTGAIAVLGSLVKDGVPTISRRWVVAALISFLLSIFAAVWLVLLLPSVAEQLYAPSHPDTQGIYDIRLYYLVPIRLGTMATIMHVCFIVGIVCFAVFVYKRAATGPLSK